MKILFIAGCYAKESEDILRKDCKGKVGIQNAPNVFQWSVIKGLFENDVDFEVISFPWLPIFPIRYKKAYSPLYEIEYSNKKVGRMYPYCTIIGLKPYSIKWRLKKEVENRLKKRSENEKTIILLYGINSFVTGAIIPLKKKFSNIKIAAIITDLIDDAFNYKTNNTFLKRIQVKREIIAQKESYKHIDIFILLTKAMEERIPEAIGHSCVVEGICDRSLDDDLPPKVDDGVRSLLYTGTLQKYVGIDDFVDAFVKTTDANYRLIICGAGPSEQYIKEQASKDKRIIYKGVVPRDEALALQQKATIVVNPRKPTEEITRYSFPSKTIEYLSSGTPMIGYQLEGISDEYYSFIYSPKGLATEDMTELIDEVLSKPDLELRERAIAARRFINESKTAKIQVRKIINFIIGK